MDQSAFRDQVIVLTGASSGIGLALACELAGRGAALVLAARGRRALEEAAHRCRLLGAEAVAVPADVTDPEAVERLAREAVEQFGRLDVWINNAGVSLVSRFAEAPPEAFRRVIETNFYGCVNGARAALARFREQRHGLLINTASVFGTLGAYSASAFAVRGFSASLRAELRDEPGIRVCTILPSSIDASLFRQSANNADRALYVPRPVREAGVVDAFLRCIARPRAEVVAGESGRALQEPRLGSHGAHDEAVKRCARSTSWPLLLAAAAGLAAPYAIRRARRERVAA